MKGKKLFPSLNPARGIYFLPDLAEHAIKIAEQGVAPAICFSFGEESDGSGV
jgi:hypothetical protein